LTIPDGTRGRTGDVPGQHLIIWLFRVAAAHRGAFEAAYGSHGPWVALFATAVGYQGSELVRGEDAGAYLTLDRWESRAHYEGFRSERRADYERLDAELEALTESEELVFEGTVLAS
jgi:heme-degrading monooxygenase HmoA